MRFYTWKNIAENSKREVLARQSWYEYTHGNVSIITGETTRRDVGKEKHLKTDCHLSCKNWEGEGKMGK